MPQDRPIVSLLFQLRDIADDTARLDVAGADGDDAAISGLAELLGVMVERAIAVLIAIQHLPGDELEQVADLCFAGGLELRRVQRELAAAPAPERLVAVETAWRKLRRAIRAVLEAARETGVEDVLGGEHRGQHHVADVASGLAVRRLYAEFRRALRDPADASPEAVLVAVRYAAGAMAMLVTSPDYPDVRASDRAVLRELRDRALRWARGERAVAAGLNLLADVRTCGDLLRGINRRQELRAHDERLIAELRSGPGGDLAAWVAALAALVGFDDPLDGLIERVRTDPAAVPAVIARLEQLQP